MSSTPPPPSSSAVAATPTSPLNVKRPDYLSWDEYFMATAFLSAMRSKDPSTQVGAVIVNAQKRIVGIGYNGMPRGCSDDALPWARQAESPLDTKYMYVCHAEMNAILNKNAANVEECDIYVALFPCNECAKIIIQSGVKRVIYMSDKHASKPETIASKKMFDLAGVQYRQFVPKMKKLVIDFDSINIRGAEKEETMRKETLSLETESMRSMPLSDEESKSSQ